MASRLLSALQVAYHGGVAQGKRRMTLKEQLLQEIDQAPEFLLEALLHFCRQMKATQQFSNVSDRPKSSAIAAQRATIKRVQAKMRQRVPRGRSLSDELIAERRMAARN